MKMYRYEARLKFMLFRVQFSERYEQLSKVTSTWIAACASSYMRRLLEYEYRA